MTHSSSIKKSYSILLSISPLLSCIFFAADAFARAGGAGGGSGGSGGGGGGGGFGGGGSYGGGSGDFGDFVIFVILMIVFAAIDKRRKAKKSALKQPQRPPRSIGKGLKEFQASHPDFSPTDFCKKVETAFFNIQDAWSAQNISSARRFLSDGVYQRFVTQILMMKLLEQENKLTNIRVKDIWIDSVDSDGAFDIIHTGIHASLKDQFICNKDSSLNSGGFEEFIEYWSFIRKKNSQNKDLYSSSACPGCGGILPESLGDICACNYCDTVLNGGDYDWVLAEITQLSDYSIAPWVANKISKLKQKIGVLIEEDKDFSVQLIEDKASNGYLQILSARTQNQPAIMKRFVSDDLFRQLTNDLPLDGIVYNRFFLNSVSLVGAVQTEKLNRLHVLIRSSYQRVRLCEDKGFLLLDPVLRSYSEVLVMERDLNYSSTKGSLYAHRCPSCGAALNESVENTCLYCNGILNSSKGDWIISEIKTLSEYQKEERTKTNKTNKTNKANKTAARIDPQVLDDLYDVKDYAFNNLLVMIAADGVFDKREKQLALAFARRYGFKLELLVSMFSLASSGKLALRVPEDLSKRKKVFALMKKAAEKDGQVSTKEKELLESWSGGT